METILLANSACHTYMTQQMHRIILSNTRVLKAYAKPAVFEQILANYFSSNPKYCYPKFFILLLVTDDINL